MTRDERRKACIESMVITYLSEIHKPRLPSDLMTLIFDAIPMAGADVVPVESTEEMIKAGRFAATNEGYYFSGLWRAMRSAGSLTNPQERP